MSSFCFDLIHSWSKLKNGPNKSNTLLEDPIGCNIPKREFQIPNIERYFQLGKGDWFSASALPDQEIPNL